MSIEHPNSINQQTIEKIAKLAKLQFKPSDSQDNISKLSEMLALIAHVHQADTDGIEPLAHPLDTMVQRLRSDRVTEGDAHLRFQAIAPNVEAGLYLVPTVIES
jgi:aspartyl-tRNA(Asn)/glutamyl-tRNA(Gln) amidotransferase subunit C